MSPVVGTNYGEGISENEFTQLKNNYAMSFPNDFAGLSLEQLKELIVFQPQPALMREVQVSH